jgi:hypothetical protein
VGNTVLNEASDDVTCTPTNLPRFLFVRLSLQKLCPAAIENTANGDIAINQIQE